MLQFLNAIVGTGVSGLLWPFQAVSPLVGLTVVSLLVAVVLLAVFKVTSNQAGLAATKRKMQASLFELRLFQEDPRAVLRAAGDLFRQQGSYLRYALVPLLWIALPLTLLLAHLQMHYGYEGLRPGQSALVKVRVKAAAAAPGSAAPSFTLDAPAGLRVETPAVWVPSLREAAWRVAADREGDYELRVALNGASETKRVRVTPLIVAHTPVRPAADAWAQLQHPSEAPLPPASTIEAIEIAYPPRDIEIVGFSIHWIVILLILSSAFALLCRPLFRVVI